MSTCSTHHWNLLLHRNMNLHSGCFGDKVYNRVNAIGKEQNVLVCLLHENPLTFLHIVLTVFKICVRQHGYNML